MAEFDPEPASSARADEQAEWNRSQDTRTRIQAVVTGLREPATAAAVADKADCSTNAARKHLEELVDIGPVRRTESAGGAQYVRNEAYFRWRRANELATRHTIDAILEKLEKLEDRDKAFEGQFDAATPDAVKLPDGATHAELEERIRTLSEWKTVRESIDRHKDALRIARRESKLHA